MGAKSYQIVQLSDIHLTKSSQMARSEPKLFGKLRGMNQAFQSIVKTKLVQESDLLVVTGDITDRGDIESWKFFWQTLDNSGLKNRTLAIHGNHDVCNLGSPRLCRKSALSDNEIKRVKRGLNYGGTNQHTTFPWGQVLIPNVLALIAIDSTNTGNSSGITNALGRIGFYQLEKLARIFRRPDIADCTVKILALHHSPNIPERRIPMQPSQDKLGAFARWGSEIDQSDRRCLRLLCLTAKVRLIIHGHMHVADKRPVNGIKIIGAPASTQPSSEKNNTYHVWSYTLTKKLTVRSKLNVVEI